MTLPCKANTHRPAGLLPVRLGRQAHLPHLCRVSAVVIKEFKDAASEVHKPGEIFWKSTPFEGSLGEPLLSTGNINNPIRPNIDNWLRSTYTHSGFINLIYENSPWSAPSTRSR